MADIAAYSRIKEKLDEQDVTLIAVSKTKPNEAILELYQAGHRDFGENRVQELVQKAADLPNDIRWHMIGHLQTNKVKLIAPFVHLIHSVDSIKLATEINKQAEKNGRVIDVLLQARIATEASKHGMIFDDMSNVAGNAELDHIKVRGVMGMATFTDDQEQIKVEFETLYEYFNALKSESINICSMGMSGDYELAIDCGSNMVRIGSAIFGARNPH
jgi:pyridoxal phosphate enzyme (YggS family)